MFAGKATVVFPLSALVKTMSGLIFTKILASLISLEGSKSFDLCLLPFFLKLLTTFVILVVIRHVIQGLFC